jgi:hypothetical protein
MKSGCRIHTGTNTAQRRNSSGFQQKLWRDDLRARFRLWYSNWND